MTISTTAADQCPVFFLLTLAFRAEATPGRRHLTTANIHYAETVIITTFLFTLRRSLVHGETPYRDDGNESPTSQLFSDDNCDVVTTRVSSPGHATDDFLHTTVYHPGMLEAA